MFGLVTIDISVGHFEAVKTLLDKGADVNSQGGPYGNALQAATVGEYIDFVQLLLEKGAITNAQGEKNTS